MKFVRVFVLVLSLFAIHFSLFAGRVAAQTAPVPNRKVPCNETDSPEFHSLRPYQASATCITEAANYAKFCGNTLTIQESVTVTYSPKEDNCVQSSPGKVLCTYAKPVAPHRITINLTGANLPIMGNTEEVTNYKGEPDQLTDAQKVNEYVSWYLNGVLNRAEYPFPDVGKNCIGESQVAGVCLNTNVLGLCLSPNPIPLLPDIPNLFLKADGTAACGGSIKSCCVTINPLARRVDILDRDKLINYSGPINKLLPQEVQQQYRANTVNNAKITRHDQIVGCTYGFEIPIINKVIIGIPAPCYETGLKGLIPRVELRLSDWKHKLPPVRSDYKDYIDYHADYERWRGKSCAEVKAPDWIPVIGGMGVVLCLDNALKPNFFSALYPYIPLSSTEDIEGNIEVNPPPSGEGLTDAEFNNQVPSTLFFSHLQESSELGSSLQDTYLAKGEPKTGPDTAVAPASSCNNLEVRSNKGDNLFATALWGDLSYTANFSCVFNPPSCSGSPSPTGGDVCKFRLFGSCVPSNWTCTKSFGNADCPSGYTCGQGCSCTEPVQTCSKTVSIDLSTSSNTPKINDVWSRLVAGPTAIVKRMFPKLGTQIGLLKDMPGSTNVTITGAESTSADLNFPHIGGISEYFLKGIQTMLRPKGYGEVISFGPTSQPSTCDSIISISPEVNDASCKLCHVDTPDTLWAISSLYQQSVPDGLPETMIAILQKVGDYFHVPPSVLLAVIWHEGGFMPQYLNGATWTEDNVKKWSLCGETMPFCSKSDVGALPFGMESETFNFYKSAIAEVFPERAGQENRCNFLDQATVAAKRLAVAANTYFPDNIAKWDTCLSIPISQIATPVNPSSCSSWNDNVVMRANLNYAGYCPEPPKNYPYSGNSPQYLTWSVKWYNTFLCQ